MNVLQKLCVVCSKCNECAMEVECLKYCDPNVVLTEAAAFRRNGLAVISLYRRLYPALRAQNAVQTSVLTLYLEMLLRELYETMMAVDAALTEYAVSRDRDRYYRQVLQLDRCRRHEAVELVFAPEVVLTVDVATLNDVERLLCKINCVYGAVDAAQGVVVCQQLLALLGRLCDVSPVASPETYRETTTCFQCYEELMAVPNQGRSIARRLQGLLCDHIAVKRAIPPLDIDVQTVEQDLGALLNRVPRVGTTLKAIKGLASFCPASYAYINEAEEALKEYNLFTEIPERIYSLSDYTYWSKTSEAIVKHAGVTMRQLNLLHNLWKTLRADLAHYLYGEEIEDIFTVGEARFAGDERLFIGSIFAAPGRLVDMITSMSVRTFESNPLFSRLHENNEIYAKIRSLIEEIREPGAVRGGEDGLGVGGGLGEEVADEGRIEGGFADALERGDVRLRTHDIHKEVSVRRRAYLKKVSEVGYNKVMACIRSQEHLITKLINVNLVGTACLEALSPVMNGFLCRRRCIELSASYPDVSDDLGYDDHLYVVNNLAHKKLPTEMLPHLGQQIYRFINGPLFTHYRDRYPLPFNVNMAYACDNGGILPHVKEDLVRCAEGSVSPTDWMVVGYLRFFAFDDSRGVNDLQKALWTHVREFVLSVALYNETFGQQLALRRVEDEDETGDGLVLTYNREAPLLLTCAGRTYRSRDLYLALYRHLSLQGSTDSHGVENGLGSSVAGVRVSDGSVPRQRAAKRPRVSLLDLVRDVDDDAEGELVPPCLGNVFSGDRRGVANSEPI